MAELKPCPVCGRKPKVKILYYPTGAECMIECKPLFRKSHKQIIRCCASAERAETYAIEAWNRGGHQMEHDFIEAVMAFMAAQKQAEERGEKEFTCPICGGPAKMERAPGNNHLHCTCHGCGFRIIE